MVDGPSHWDSWTHVGEPEAAPGPQLHIRLALAIGAIWEMHQKTEDVSL